MPELPPPLPPRQPQTVAPAAAAPAPRRLPALPGWLVALIATCVLLFLLMAGACAWLVGWGWNLFAGQARDALQAQPAVQAQIGQIREMDLAFFATGAAPGAEEFVFDLAGDRGQGRVTATFVSMGAEREIITDGDLAVGGQHFALEDQSALDDGMQDDGGDGDAAPGDEDDGTDEGAPDEGQEQT